MGRRQGDIWPIVGLLSAFSVGMIGLTLLMTNDRVYVRAQRLKGIRLSPETLAQLAYDVGWRGEDLVMAVAIMLAESGGWTEAVNVNRHKDGSESIDRGLFQVNSRYWPSLSPEDAFSPAKNVAYAYSQIWKRYGWKPWVTFIRSMHQRHLERARKAVQSTQPKVA